MSTQIIDVGPGTQAWPAFAEGRSYRLLGGRHRKGRLDLFAKNVRFILQPGFVHDGGRVVGNALYARGSATGLRFEREPIEGPAPSFENFLKSVFYYSNMGSIQCVLDGQMWLGASGSDETGLPSDSGEDGPQDHGIYMDGGEFVIVGRAGKPVRFHHNTGCGGHPYSGSGRNTNVRGDWVECDFNGFDGWHNGAASGRVVLTNVLLHDNGKMHATKKGWGLRNYNDSAPPNELLSGYVWNNSAGQVQRKVNGLELVVGPDVVFAAPPAIPPPDPGPEEPPPVDPCQSWKDALATCNAERGELARQLEELALANEQLSASNEALEEALRNCNLNRQALNATLDAIQSAYLTRPA